MDNDDGVDVDVDEGIETVSGGEAIGSTSNDMVWLDRY